MKINIFNRLSRTMAAAVLLVYFAGCERDVSELEPASFPSNPEVFIDGFSAGLNYAAFGGSVPTAFDVDNNVTLNNSAASMRFEVPNEGDPRGSFAGGVFYTDVGRDLSGYNALTFWAKASQAAVIGEIGFGNDLGANRFVVSLQGLRLSTGWRKYIIPIPDPSRLTQERGLFWYAAGNMDGNGFTFWIDEVKFENIGTIANPRFNILDGNDQVETSFIGVTKNIGGLQSVFNMPDGIDQTTSISPAYFEFQSSNPSIATVDNNGFVAVTGGAGNAQITATVGDVTANGSLSIQSLGNFNFAPVPTRDPARVISIFSEAYTNAPVDYYNGYWAPFQTTGSADFIIEGDRILHYTDFNFVGIQFTNPTIDVSTMTHLHLNIYLPNVLPANARFKIELVDFGTPNVVGAFTQTITVAQSQQWLTLEIPLASFSGLTRRTQLAQIIFVDDSGNIPNFFADNIYFYNNNLPPPGPPQPSTAAPVPTHPAADVLSVFSDTYPTIPGTNLNPGWGQATVVSQVQIQGNNTLRLAGLNYQGIELGSSQNVSAMNFLHLDFWTANSTLLKVFLISPGPVETEFSLQVPTTGWSSIDIPLSSFAPVNLNDVIQLKFEGNGDIFLDNIYFRKN